ncbi:(2Fe-2S)-binding protein [Streptomyces sp. F8]|uniref:(2Fe-2S)-binding protein n=1 Tax=Streptomyces sp. F8 TaxID=1436085 RepID=UPI0029D275B9|nr:(2Fe-2S)-binding protein [Streptomyces sp. F8]MDX6759108.1 (2Fe-2S)-binding protein [Streptomyces sp. F8]
MDDVLRRLADVGPFFTVGHGEEPPGPGFLPLTALYDGHLDPYVAEVGRRIGSGPGRVAASTAQFGIASRLWSIGLGCAALSGRVPDLAADRVWWRLPEAGSLQLWLPEPAGRPAEDLGESVLGHLALLETALRARYGVSPTVLRGNAASGLVGALRVLIDRVPGGAAPGLVRDLLAEDGALAGTGAFLHEEGLGVAFVRRSCCLYYRVPSGGGLCGDCVLRTRRSG